MKTKHRSNLFIRTYLLLVLLMANDGGELQSIKREVSSSGLVKILNFIKTIPWFTQD